MMNKTNKHTIKKQNKTIPLKDKTKTTTKQTQNTNHRQKSTWSRHCKMSVLSSCWHFRFSFHLFDLMQNVTITQIIVHGWTSVQDSERDLLVTHSDGCYIDGLVQERRNSSALAMELCLSCTNASTYSGTNVVISVPNWRKICVPNCKTICVTICRRNYVSNCRRN